MDNHPIPQDVTGFQFRLIGSMTVKQFAYVAVGGVSAVIFFYLPVYIIIKILLIPLSIIGGVMLAFVPIEGRPIDTMVANFLKALLSPNQFLYHRSGGQLLLSTIHIEPKVAGAAASNQAAGVPAQRASVQKNAAREQQLAAYLNTLHTNQVPDEQETTRLNALFGPTPQAATQPATPAKPTVVPEPSLPQTPVPATDTAVLIQQDTAKIAEEEALLKQVNAELTEAKSAEQADSTNAAAHSKVSDLEKQLQEIMAAKAQLEQELQSLKVGQAPTPKVVTTPAVATVPVIPGGQSPLGGAPTPANPPATAAPVAPTTPPSGQSPLGATPAKGSFPSLPDVPNIFLGIVRDSSGNVLPNILVEVTDKEGNPVRAFKTNQLGQFMSATPLKEGEYTVQFEDAKNQYKFDPTPLVVNNQILQPLEVAAHDLRSELRKSLFA